MQVVAENSQLMRSIRATNEVTKSYLTDGVWGRAQTCSEFRKKEKGMIPPRKRPGKPFERCPRIQRTAPARQKPCRQAFF